MAIISAALAAHLDGGTAAADPLPVSPPTSPGDADEFGSQKHSTRTQSRTRARTSESVANREAIDEMADSLSEARQQGAPVGLLLELAKNLSVARQRTKAGQHAVSAIRTMELEPTGGGNELDSGGTEESGLPLMRPAEADALLNRELRLCESALSEVRYRCCPLRPLSNPCSFAHATTT